MSQVQADSAMAKRAQGKARERRRNPTPFKYSFVDYVRDRRRYNLLRQVIDVVVLFIYSAVVIALWELAKIYGFIA